MPFSYIPIIVGHLIIVNQLLLVARVKMKPIDLEVSKTLKELRLSAKLSQREIAKSIGVTDTQWQNYEYGRQVPGFDKAIAMAKILNCSLKTLAESLGYDVTGIPDDY